MACLVRVSLTRLACNNGKLLNASNNVKVLRTISSRITRADEDLPAKPKPWPYQTKSFTLLNYFFDKTTARFDENSKIIVVEGPVAAGKTKLAKELACELEMLYLPEANLDMTYINDYGFDLRTLDAQLPESCRSFDNLTNPELYLTSLLEQLKLCFRLSQYIDALAHVLSTGQGVVLDRCVYSDFVFAEAMRSQGYLSKLAHKKYYEFRDCTISELLRPHLVIYLDVPVPKVIENIKKRAISYEKNSSVLTPQKHAELLVYDWTDEGDVEIVVEDIERIDFNRHDLQDSQLKDWDHSMEEEWAVLRHKYADKKNSIMNYCNLPAFEVPELVAPGEEYEKGYNTDLGDRGWLFKIAVPHRNTLPLRERRTSL
ncbi:hypothetical protein NQ314_017802 [Rhamnusium bicolor]|uniref:NADH dehydrogenase [ubiquinone] 1 alpha subcomplex subunit 10, mitochondrial n=1 Tax=Rhamnusium bicolor TaxID=1586634 RepID=A0AAV8WSW2_9CUCU|nr:hypothetical protein NQ314_017802 [Rhamnusium bicolor]